MTCGAPQVTRSHLFATDLRAQFTGGRFGTDITALPRDDRQLRIRTQTRNIRQSEMWVKVLCADCNGAWMNRIERDAIPVLVSIVTGERLTIDAHQQRQIREWATICAMLRSYVAPGLSLLPEEARVALRIRGADALPVSVWLVRADLESPFREPDGIDTTYLAGPDVLVDGCLVYLWLGPLVVVVALGGARDPLDRHLRVLGPATGRLPALDGSPLHWPFRGSASDEQVWWASGLDDRDVRELLDRSHWHPGRVERHVMRITPGVDDAATIRRRLSEGTASLAHTELAGARRFATFVPDDPPRRL